MEILDEQGKAIDLSTRFDSMYGEHIHQSQSDNIPVVETRSKMEGRQEIREGGVFCQKQGLAEPMYPFVRQRSNGTESEQQAAAGQMRIKASA